MNAQFETPSSFVELSSIRLGFFTREGGISSGSLQSLNCAMRPTDTAEAVEENRSRALRALHIEGYPLVIPRLAHGNTALIIDPATAEKVNYVEADAVITAHEGIALGITYADCLPILIAASDQSVVAAIHAGWRGVLCGIIESTITLMRQELGAWELHAAVGPAISCTGFSVTDDVYALFKKTWPDFVHDERARRANVDLTGIARMQLNNLGVLAEKVGGYTDLDAKRYYSHRRDGGNTGRHVAIIAKVPTN